MLFAGLLLVLCVVGEAALSKTDNIPHQYCEPASCADAQRISRNMRLQQIAIDASARQLKALTTQQLTRTKVFSATAIFPTRGPVTGGTKVHICGFGFSETNQGREGQVKDNRIFCHFRLNQTRMAELSRSFGVTSANEAEVYNQEQPYAAPGLYKNSGIKRISPGNRPSFTNELTAIEELYSKFLTVNATFVDDTEVVCVTPSIVDIPIGFPIVATVTLSINGKEQFHQFSGYNPPSFTFFDQRSTRDGSSTVHTPASQLGRKKPESFIANKEEDLAVIR
eukprot:c13280_g1_i2.p1 GENE.c13280_g1_i2~~c13280_g1_i2.p1  ORF type:complete len:281 (+),score=62.00 c13280_g1_i2:39-881(+)